MTFSQGRRQRAVESRSRALRSGAPGCASSAIDRYPVISVHAFCQAL